MARSPRHRKGRRVREAAAQRYAPDPKQEELTGVLLDSDVIIEILRGRRAVVDAVRSLEGSAVPTYCTAISWAEIYAGIRPGEEAVTEAFFNARGEVILDAVAGRHAGHYLARYARSHGVEIADALIAAATTTVGLRLWTLNRRHYPMPDVRFYEP
jgi:predicted nucleic acid-binding protein